ncbi:phosphotransferase (plasmid) [Diaphorobacter sp. HDW4B]|uniref:phosphotransferase n=1 Tax=Diaphorobacter sp. HDW4B TaxID=2714925 RepID=UPI001407E15A|nr:phosphotransferase [Diaphorobacter sp. HDW4B]QIL73999.1 phosphotransferase [Diaphorobacter sp. HDW4B]
MPTSDSLPRTLEELTPQWLSSALQKSLPGASFSAIEIERVLWGTATKVLAKVSYADPQPEGAPAQLCIKGEFDERARAAVGGESRTGTQMEALFFNGLAGQLGIPLPRHWYAGSEPGMGILVLDNLAAKGYGFGNPTEPWPADRVADALDILATLHGSTWGKRYPELDWLSVGSTAVRHAAEMLMSDQHWKGQFSQPDVYQLPSALTDNQRLIRGYRALWAYDDQHADCVIHGDAHVGNTCFDPQGSPFFIDWAGPCHSHWGTDVPYFLVGALSVEDRRALERDLFAHYLKRLAHHGGPALDAALAWDDYRRHMVHGMMWATLPTALQSSANVHAMGERYAQAMLDHDTLALLGV